jgi:hypothetical protein
MQFFFSLTPNPVPGLWTKIRRDFPPATNHLLELAKPDWFETNGWLSATDTRFERRMISNCAKGIADYDDDGQTVPVGPAAAPSLGSCVTAAELFAARRDLRKLRSAVEELAKSFPRDYPGGDFLRRLDDLEKRLISKATTCLAPGDETIDELARLKREMLVKANPLLRDVELLLVKRYTYDSKHYYDDFQHISRWGGNLYVLSLSNGHLRKLVPQLDGGIFDSCDVSFDGRRVVFGYRRPKQEGFRIYEVGVDGKGLRQVVLPPADEDRRLAMHGRTSYGDGFYGLMGYQFWTDDVHPCYLPDGGFCFASTRCEHGVLCTPNHYLACTTLFRCDADGSNLRPISQGALSEFTPTMMEDGRILYNRWEYVYKGIAAVQPLWVMRPDGSGSEEFYGDNVANPGVLWQARQIPGHPRLAVCIGCGHEPMGVGQVLLLDMDRNKRTTEPMISLTPDTKTQGLRGLYQRRNGVWKEDVFGPFYRDPYPLSDSEGRGAGKFFLVSCNPDKRYNDPCGYGIYLLDVFGNRVPVYDDPEISCWQPMPLRPRKRPPVLAPFAKTGADAENGPARAVPASDAPDPSNNAVGTMFINDVYRGLDGVKPGTVKYIRVMEQVPKPWTAELDQRRNEDRSADGVGGHLAISYCAHIWVAVLHGIVEVAKDGSACFEVPARRNLFFQALDENFMEVQKMRTFINVEPGEQRSCIGCHEQRVQAPVSRKAEALARKPVKLAAQPGEVAPRPLYYPTDVQPVLDRHCVRCHSGSEPKAKLDLSGELTTLFSRSYENLLRKGLVNFIQEWSGPAPDKGGPAYVGNGSMMHAEAVLPYTYGSHKSRLIEVLRKGHHDVKLAREEFIKLVTWVDANAPFYGSYFGRRNIKYQGAPDFRPVPTVASASGIMPEPVRPPHVSAQLLAWWRFDEGAGETAQDASGNKHDARIVRATRTPDAKLGEALKFDGNGHVEAGKLGAHETLSVALWVKAGELKNTWSPLLFTHSRERSAFHFSLLRDGTPNVAINAGGTSWIHRRARRSFADGQWHHLAVVCDSRSGGNIRFYIDGRKDTDIPLDTDVPLDLAAFRLGAWSAWEKQPSNNFHGLLDDVRIYSGLLKDAEVADLAKGASVRTAASR